MPKRTARVRDEELSAGLELEGMVVAGTEPAYEALGPHEHVYCIRCGSRIGYVFLTSHGPMGGDCYATLSGDDTTRSAWRKIGKKLDFAMHVVESKHGRVTAIAVEHEVPIFHGGSTLHAVVAGQRPWFLGVIPDKALAVAIGASLAEQHDLDLVMQEG